MGVVSLGLWGVFISFSSCLGLGLLLLLFVRCKTKRTKFNIMSAKFATKYALARK
jgi:hypothetical protein